MPSIAPALSSPSHEHQFCRAAEFDDADGDSALYPLDQCVLKEAGQSESRVCLALRVLQFLPDTPDVACHASNGSGVDRSHMDN